MVAGPSPGAQTSALTYIGLPISSGGAHGLGTLTRREALNRTLAFLRDCTETDGVWYEFDQTYTRTDPTPGLTRRGTAASSATGGSPWVRARSP